jgi:hypothetical protein
VLKPRPPPEPVAASPTPQPAERSSTAAADALDLGAYAQFIVRLEAGVAIDERFARLVDAAIATSMRPGFEEFVSLSHLRFVPARRAATQTLAASRALIGCRDRAIRC